MKSVALHNLGCKVNSYEIEVMQQMLQEKGYTIVPFDEIADIYIVNTCTVTNIADRKSRQMLHRAKQKNPAALVVAVGCYVQTGREDVEQDPALIWRSATTARRIWHPFWRNIYGIWNRKMRWRRMQKMPDMVWTRLCMTLLS